MSINMNITIMNIINMNITSHARLNATPSKHTCLCHKLTGFNFV